MLRRYLLASILALTPILGLGEEVVTNVGAGLPRQVSVDELRDYFLAKKPYFPNGVKVQVFVFHRDSIVSRYFLMNTLRVSPSAFYDLIESAAATGKSNLPIVIESDSRMSVVIAVTKGGIGVVRSAAYAANIPSVKIIEVKE